MKASVLVSPGCMRVDEVPEPRPSEGQVRVKLEGCGVCASNLPPWEGRPWFEYPMAPGALGHEGWGRIDQIGPGVSDYKEGDRVAFLSYNSYAEYDVAPVDSLVPLPSFLESRPFPGEPLACAMNIFERSGISRGDTIAVVGVGFLGSLVTNLASHAGAKVIAIARRSFALSLASSMGAEITLAMKDPDTLAEKVLAANDGELCDVVVECAGKQESLDVASKLCRIRGTLVIAGYHQDGLRQVNLQDWNWRGLDVINAHERDPDVYMDGMRSAIVAVHEGTLHPFPLFTHRFSLEQLPEALELTGKRPFGFLKGLILF